MRKDALAACSAVCFVVLSCGPTLAAEQGQCWHPHEIEAARVRNLQTMLMLETLKCKAVSAGMAEKYDAFANSRHRDIVGYDNILKARFMRASGISGGERAYQDFATKIANAYSGTPRTASSCQMADTLLGLAVQAKDDELPLLARTFAETPPGVGEECSAAPAPAPVAVAAAVAPAPVADPPPVAAAPAAAPVTMAAAPAPSPAAALEAAAMALQSAAAAMKAQGSADPQALPTPTPAVATETKPSI